MLYASAAYEWRVEAAMGLRLCPWLRLRVSITSGGAPPSARGRSRWQQPVTSGSAAARPQTKPSKFDACTTVHFILICAMLGYNWGFMDGATAYAGATYVG